MLPVASTASSVYFVIHKGETELLVKLETKKKEKSDYSSLEEILSGVTQGSILGTRRNIGFASYTNNSSPYLDGVKQATESFKNTSDELFYWFVNSQMKKNLEKHHLITS